MIGSKEAIAHFPFAFVNPGDVVLLPRPGLSRLRDADPVRGRRAVPPAAAPRERLPASTWTRSRPTSRAARRSCGSTTRTTRPPRWRRPASTRRVVAFAQKYDVIVASDLAYSEMYYEAPPRSFLETPGAHEVGIEFHSLSKTYNMTGWRVGWACGNAALVAGLGKVKTNVDSGVFEAVQRAAIAALSGDQAPVARQRAIYKERRDVLCGGPDGGRLRRAHAEGQLLHADRQPRRGYVARVRGAPADRGGHRRDARDRLRPVGRRVRAPDRLRRQGAPRRGGPAAWPP